MRYDLNKLETGYFGACYSNDDLAKVEKFFEKSQLGEYKLPEDTPIPTHIFSIVCYKYPFVLKGKFYEPGVYVFEAKQKGYIVRLLTDAYKFEDNFRLLRPKIPYTDEQKEAYRLKAEFLHTISKSYGFLNFALEAIHTKLGLHPGLYLGVNFHRVICSEAQSICANAAVPGTSKDPADDTPLDVVANPNYEFIPESHFV